MNEFEKALQVIAEVKKAVLGKDECIVKCVAAILAGGHILLNDIPGVGKTTLAVALARAMSLESGRVQFTPDVMPADITGFSMYRKETNSFEYQPGSIMCNIFLADELNRTSPKTQSALLEVMEEGQVTVDGATRPVPDPFVVIATQNPFGSAGTQLMPESQLDRFMVCMTMGYPSMEDELAILKGEHRNRRVQPVITARELQQLKAAVEAVYIKDEVYEYVARLADRTRNHEEIALGLSPRGTLCLAAMARSLAFLRQRDYVIPADVLDIAPAVMGHRLMPKRRGAHEAAQEELVSGILREVKRPAVLGGKGRKA